MMLCFSFGSGNQFLMMYSMCLLYISYAYDLLNGSMCFFFNSQYPTAKLPYHIMLFYPSANSMNFSAISYVKSHYVFDTAYEHIVA